LILVIAGETPGIVLFEGLAASGLRSIRYALEVEGIEEIIASDISSDAFQLMSRNVEDNQVSQIVKPVQMDARCVLVCKVVKSSGTR
jgi:tRNA (guanine26-N2/guanine27-N2)-dimethyltransferase